MEDLLRPVFMSCPTKNAKVITITLSSLQRLISLRAVSLSAVPAIIQTMNDCMSQGVDIQLRILQTLLSFTNFPCHARPTTCRHAYFNFTFVLHDLRPPFSSTFS